MTKSYFGFVYLWRDRLRKMSYIGSHMGSLNDPYKGSSVRLLRVMKRRPQDFRRRILWILTVDDRKLLLAEEERWLQMIKSQHLQVRYYNIKRRGTGGFVTEGYTPEQRAAYLERLSQSRRGKLHYAARACHCMGQDYNTVADAKQFLGWDPIRRIRSRKFVDFYFIDEGQPSTQEIEKNLQKASVNKQRCIDAMKEANKALPAEHHKQRARKAGLTHRGQKWSKDVNQRIGRKVYLDGTTYLNLRHASEALCTSAYLLRKRCKSDEWPNCYFIDD